MKVFSYLFTKYGIPILFVGSIGGGVKLYFNKTWYSFQSVSSAKEFLDANLPALEKHKSYLEVLQEAKYTVVNKDTSEQVLQNILTQRLFPTRHAQLHYPVNRMFSGSKAVTFKQQTYTNQGGKTIKYLEKPTKEDTENLKQACIQALAGTKPESQFAVPRDNATKENKETFSELSRLREWCTEPKVKHVLARHKLTLLNTDENKHEDDTDWKEVIAGGWFKKEGDKKNWESQTFIKDTSTFLGNKKDSNGIESISDVTEEQIKALKKQCQVALEKNFERKSFYLTKDFIDDIKDGNKPDSIDEFQEAALFCSKPMSAGDYVKKAMQGIVDEKLDAADKQDYCFVDGKDKPNDYSEIKTNNPMSGKTFWCAVRMVYDPKK
ncbi:hypothetical protein MHSWG343_10220 [Candidatus Mycoplasma haematohominis]|uniref:Uncharacterized protein n=1 Tax=Candidatus Mycoplasma haematohominis TaxID=1494318 RepID=A0A478FSF9_9MOLU|nr:hypothetical protein MHSWG343_10220 [Candidatus Mycoplasma haemohominis]